MNWTRLRAAVWRGSLAGAAGTTALDTVTYLDMALRNRPSSDLPGRTAERLAESVGVKLDANRKTASGALIGYADGVCSGAAYGVLRSAFAVPWAAGAVGLAALTLIVGEGTATRLGTTDWSHWNAAQWLEDVIPRLAYGAVTAAAMEAFARVDES